MSKKREKASKANPPAIPVGLPEVQLLPEPGARPVPPAPLVEEVALEDMELPNAPGMGPFASYPPPDFSNARYECFMRMRKSVKPSALLDAALHKKVWVERDAKMRPSVLTGLYYSKGGRELVQSLLNPETRKSSVDAILCAQVVGNVMLGQLADTVIASVDSESLLEQIATSNSPLNQAIKIKHDADRESRAGCAALKLAGGPQIANITLENAETVNFNQPPSAAPEKPSTEAAT